MQTLAVVLVLIAFVGAIISIINVIYPIKAIGFVSRKRAVLAFFVSSCLFAIGIITAGVSTSDNPQNESLWLSIPFVIATYGLFRFVRRGSQKRKSARKSVPPHSVHDHENPIQYQHISERKSGRIVSPSKIEGSVRRTRTTRKSTARWIQPSDMATVAGRKIGGMIYLGAEPRQESWKREGCSFIDPSLSVAKFGSDFSGLGISYWPSYGAIDSRARATYLDWLAGDRADRRIGPGYVFLYFYGLERRFFVDTPDEEEKRLLVAETERLLDVYGENHSVRQYLGAFLDAAQVVLEPAGDAEPRFERSGYELPLGLRIAIGRMAKEKLPLSANWLLGWYTAHPEHWLRTAATRAFPEFRTLFTLLFDEQFPKGLKMRTPKRLLSARYVSASRAFEADLGPFLGDIPDISGISRPLAIAKELVEEATDALDKYSRFLGRNPEGRDTIEAHALLPERLWPLFPNAAMESLHRWAEEIIEVGGLSPVEQVIERLEGAPPEKIGKRQLTGAADALARLSIGMAPDPRFALRSPKLGEPVVLFRLPEGITALEEVSDKYKNILIAIAMGSFIAHADGTIAAKERSALKSRIDTAELPEAERARLLANLQWMLAIPPDAALFRRRLKDTPETVRHELGQVALAMAAADGVVDPGEIKAIERLYKTIGLTTDGVYSDLHALTARGEPVTVRKAGEQEQGFAIPPPPEREGKVVLDPGRIASLMADTAHVSSVLGKIFPDDDPDEDLEETQENIGGRFQGLDARHAAFLGELLTRMQWDKTEFAVLAGQFRLMQAGALETLNEWSFERFDDVLIEEYEGYELNPDVAAELRN
ncbi:MAG: TerB N-terminal domain-containing protein [Thiotrichales bacterium]|nr:TerB N-terminal domain-containing protein [Thiotrichales bacterium]